MYLYDKEITSIKWHSNPINGEYVVECGFAVGQKTIKIPGDKLIEYSVFSNARFESDQLIVEYLFNYCGLKLEKVYLQ
jgi:hypothetical protein